MKPVPRDLQERLRRRREALARTVASTEEELRGLERHVAGGCGGAIPLARLRAVPETRHCLACQAREETDA